MANLSFGELTEAQKLEVADLVQKLEAIDGAIAAVQTKRAELEAKLRDRDNFLQTQRMKVQVALRAIRQAEIQE